jgi:uncharacterized Zn-binding protein involved in type VI secretion
MGIDKSAGHCFPPRAADEGSSNVFVNGVPVVCVGHHYPNHTCGDETHDGVASTGSSSVFVNGQALTRIADAISCGDMAGSGSPDFFVG